MSAVQRILLVAVAAGLGWATPSFAQDVGLPEPAPDSAAPSQTNDGAEPDGATPDAPGPVGIEGWAERLGVTPDALTDGETVAQLGADQRAAAASARANLDAVEAELSRANAVLKSMEDGHGESAINKVQSIRRRLALGRVRQLVGRVETHRSEISQAEMAAAWLDGHKSRQEDEARRRNQEAAEAARLREEARKAEAEASEASQQKLEEIAIAEREVVEAQDARSRKRVELATQRATIARETYYIVERRKWRVRELEAEGAANAALLEWQKKVEAKLITMSASADGDAAVEEDPHDAADKLYQDLGRRRADARTRIEDLSEPVSAASSALRRAAEGDAGASAEQDADEDDVELARGRASLVAALRERQREHVKLLELRRSLAERALDRAYVEFRFARQSQSELVPFLPATRRNQIRTLNTPNVQGVASEFTDFWIVVKHEASAETRLLIELPGRAFSVEGILWLGKFGFYFLLVVIAVRLVRNRREGFATEATRFVLDHNILRLPPKFVVKFFEVLQAISIDLTALVGVLVIIRALPGELPVFALVQSLVYAVYGYRIGTTAVETLMLPRWYRENTDREKWGATTPVDIGGDGIDLFDLELERAQFATGTARVLLIYTVICQLTLWVARATLGTFFLTFWVHVVGYLGYGIVVYVLLSLWKGTIARQFTRLDDGKSTEAEGFVTRHKDKFWGVVVIFGALAWLAGRAVMRWARKYLTGLDVTRQLGNFFLRKRIEREAGAKAVQRQPLTDTLPAELLEAFGETPAQSLPHLIPRAEQMAEIAENWDRFVAGHDGSVAIVGENGMGKSTFLHDVEEQLRAGSLRVDSADLDDKLVTEADLVGFVAGTLGVDLVRYDVMTLVERVLAGPRRAVVIDDCHHTFLRGVEGFAALDALLELVSLTNHHVFWALAFDELGWKYMNRFRSWGTRVKVLTLTGLGDDGVRQLIESRIAGTGFRLSFDNLVVSHGGRDKGYQVVESAAGYFRLLTEFSKGNPRIAVRYWLRSLSIGEDAMVHVSLFDTQPSVNISDLRSDEGFALAAIIQHDTLDAAELSRVLGSDVEICALYLNAWRETGLIRVDPNTGRARAVPDQLRQLRRQLGEIHFLYGA